MARQQINLRTFARKLGATKPLARKNAKPEPAVHKIKQTVLKYTSFYSLFFLTTWSHHPYAMPFQPSTFCDQESCRMREGLRDKPKNGLFCGTDSQLRDDGALEYIYVLTGFFIPNSILFGNKSTSKAKLKRAVSFWN